jgi:hypothetical protein
MKEDSAMREILRFVEEIPPPHPSLRARAMAAVPADDRRPDARLRWAAMAAVLLAALVVGTLVFATRAVAPHARPAAQPTPHVPRPSPVAGTLDVPDSTPVIMLRSRAAAITWTGQRGMLGVEARLVGHVVQSPDGSRFLVERTVLDRQGAAVGDVPLGSVEYPVWADDSRQLCGLRLPSSGRGRATLELLQPGRPARDVADVGVAPGPVEPFSYHVEACSVLNDRAVVSEGTSSTLQAWLVQLSSGRVLRHITFPSTAGDRPVPVHIVVSRDASMLAEMTGPFSPTGPGQPTTIVRLSDGATLARLDGRMVLAFSWNADLVVAAPSFGEVPSVIDWRTATVLWTAGGPIANGPLAEPNGTRLAVGTQAGDVWIVAPDGQATLAATRDSVSVA